MLKSKIFEFCGRHSYEQCPAALHSQPPLRSAAHARVLADGVRISGCTIHFVRAEMDAGPIIVQAALLVGFAILFEAGLSFLGLSDPNVMSWGAIMGNNRPYILQQGFMIMYPGLAIFVTVLSISLIGDGLNDALNPKLRRR